MGADVSAWSALEPLDMWRGWVRDGHRVLQRLAHLRQPTIAAINGYAFGGGLRASLRRRHPHRRRFSDVRAAGDEDRHAARMGRDEATPEAIGVARSKQMIFSGGRIDAHDRGAVGFVNEAVAPGALMDRCRALALEIATNARFRCSLPRR